MRGEFIGYLKNGWPVYDRPKSHVHTEYPGIWDMVKSLLPDIDPDLSSNYVEINKDCGEVIGESICVETTDTDDIVYAKRPRRDGYTRFVKNRDRRPTTHATIVLKKMREEDAYMLVTAYHGEQAPPEPWDKEANERSVPFWQTHALIWGTVPTEEGTETTECPW